MPAVWELVPIFSASYSLFLQLRDAQKACTMITCLALAHGSRLQPTHAGGHGAYLATQTYLRFIYGQLHIELTAGATLLITAFTFHPNLTAVRQDNTFRNR